MNYIFTKYIFLLFTVYTFVGFLNFNTNIPFKYKNNYF
jgi:hypothetical protein